MVTWAEFTDAAPELAARGEKRLRMGVAFMGTTAKDGSARVHPFTPLLGGGRLLALIATHTVKYGNLLRDGRCAIHAWLGESDEEFAIIGRAVVSDGWATRMQAAIEAKKITMTSKDDVAFEFMIDSVHWAIWDGLGTPNIKRRAERWPWC